MIWVLENGFVDAECSKQNFLFFKVLYFNTKKNKVQACERNEKKYI